MGRYIVHRLISAVPVLLIVTLISFCVMQLVPGDPAAVMAGPQATRTEIEQVRAQLGLDQPFLHQLGRWYLGLAQGDLGRSILLGRSVAQAIAERLPVTIALAPRSPRPPAGRSPPLLPPGAQRCAGDPRAPAGDDRARRALLRVHAGDLH